MFKFIFIVVETGLMMRERFIVKAKTGSKLLIGRSRECNIRLESDIHCSPKHALIYWDQETCFIEDLHSANGTFVSKSRIEGKKELRDEDVVKVGNTSMVIAIKDFQTSRPAKSENESSVPLTEFDPFVQNPFRPFRSHP